MDIKQQSGDVPATSLWSIFNALYSSRGSLPTPTDPEMRNDGRYAFEITFRTTDADGIKQLADRVKLGKEAYLDVAIPDDGSQSGNAVIYVELKPLPFALCIAQNSLQRADGRAWDTENDLLVILTKGAIDSVLIPEPKAWVKLITLLRSMEGSWNLLMAGLQTALGLLNPRAPGDSLGRRLARVISMFDRLLLRLNKEDSALRNIRQDLEAGKI
jgi:hypothetical protein